MHYPLIIQNRFSFVLQLGFMGTMVTGGHGMGVVVATGEKTQFGQVFRYVVPVGDLKMRAISPFLKDISKATSIMAYLYIYILEK